MFDQTRKQIFKFSALQWFLWSSWCTFGAFNVYHLGERGLSNALIGTLVSVQTLSGIIGQYFWGYICDRFRTVKKVFIFAFLGLILLIVPFPLYVNHPPILMVALGLIGFFWSAQPPIVDSWTVETSPVLARNYGFTRAWGSIGFALLASVFGRLITTYGWNIMFFGFGFMALITIAIASTIEDGYRESRETKVGTPPTPAQADLRLLLTNRDYVLLVIAAFVLFVPHQLMMVFLPAILKSVGGSPVDQGTAMFVLAASEVPVFMLSVLFIRKFPHKTLLLVSACFFLLRIVLLNFAHTPQFVIAIGTLQSLSFGIFFPTMIAYVKKIAPDGLRTAAQTIAAGCYLGLSAMVGSVVGGSFIDRFGVALVLRGAALLSLLGVTLFFVQFLRQGRPQATGEKQSAVV